MISSMTSILSKDGSVIVDILRLGGSYDQLNWLREYLRYHKIVNGISTDYDSDTMSNGMEELAAKIVMHMKQRSPTGDVYLVSPAKRETTNYLFIVKQVKNIVVVEPITLIAPISILDGENRKDNDEY